MADTYNTIAPRFRSTKAFIKDVNESYENELKFFIPINQKKIDDFIDAKDNYFGYLLHARGGLSFISTRALIRFVATCLQENSWDFYAYQQIIFKIILSKQWDFYVVEKWRIQYLTESEPREVGFMTTPNALGDLVCFAATLGNREIFNSVVQFSLELFDKKLVGSNITSLTQLFVMRLAEIFLNVPARDWLADTQCWAVDPCKKEPLFAELMNHWDDEDTTILEVLLAQLLNRHTFQAARNNKDGGKDYGGLYVERFPLEVFFILRLREWKGLSAPKLEHCLMEPPFHQLPKSIENLVPDEEIVQLMEKIRTAFPDYDDFINQAKTRDWKIMF